jgi:hypothetical protein
LCIYISFGRIGYCLVVYTVPCLGIIYAVGPGVATIQTLRRPFLCDVRQRKVLDIAIDEVSGHCLCTWCPRPYGLFVVPTGVIVQLGLHNRPRSWISTVGPSLPGFTMAPCVDSLLCYRSIRQPKSILQDSLEVESTYMHFAYLHISCLTLT